MTAGRDSTPGPSSCLAILPHRRQSRALIHTPCSPVTPKAAKNAQVIRPGRRDEKAPFGEPQESRMVREVQSSAGLLWLRPGAARPHPVTHRRSKTYPTGAGESPPPALRALRLPVAGLFRGRPPSSAGPSIRQAPSTRSPGAPPGASRAPPGDTPSPVGSPGGRRRMTGWNPTTSPRIRRVRTNEGSTEHVLQEHEHLVLIEHQDHEHTPVHSSLRSHTPRHF